MRTLFFFYSRDYNSEHAYVLKTNKLKHLMTCFRFTIKSHTWKTALLLYLAYSSASFSVHTGLN